MDKDDNETPATVPQPNYHHVTMMVSGVTQAPYVRGEQTMIARVLLKMDIKDAVEMRKILDEQIQAWQPGMGFVAVQAEGEFR